MSNSVYILPDFQNNYLELLVGSLPDGTVVYGNQTTRPFALFLPDIVRHRPDVLHLHWPHPYFLFYDLIPGKLTREIASWIAALFFLLQLRLSKRFVDTVVWTVHNLENHDRLQPRVESHVHASLADIADEVTVWDSKSEEIVQELFDLDGDDTHIVPHNNYCELYESVDSENRPQICDVGEEYDRVFLFFGRIRKYKNVEKLIAVFGEVVSDEHLLIVAGNPEDALRERVSTLITESENVRGDLRYIPDDEVPHYFEVADIAVFPYEKIFNSGSIVLSMSFGVPFVAPNKGAVPGIAPDGNIVYSSLPQGLQNAVEIDREQLAAVGRRNRLIAQQRHSREAVETALLGCYGWDHE